MTINEQRTLNLLLESIKQKATREDVDRLNRILAEQEQILSQKDQQLQEMNKQLVAKEIMGQARKQELADMKKQMIQYNQEEIQQKEEAAHYKTELERKLAQIQQMNQQANNQDQQELSEWKNTVKVLCSFLPGFKASNMSSFTSFTSFTSFKFIDADRMGWVPSYPEKRNSKNHTIRSNNIYQLRVCPSDYLNNQGWHCIYFNIEDGKLVKTGGCNLEQLL
ncbi:hypothetical protein D5085_09775 [Ectothiorhodospiraceae bacterium BW-2]|nr:hypothetical protein D5085_09775 [Ectothiorhodospiraceae bacterium BW-2]